MAVKKKWWFAFACCGVLIVAGAAVLRNRHIQNVEETKRPTVQEVQASTAPTPPHPLLFGVEQNDPEGYDRLAWGSSSKDNREIVPVADSEDGLDPILEKIVGPPGEEKDSEFIPDKATAPTVHVLQKRDSQDVQYGFYNDELAWVSVKMQGSYSDVQRELDSKYPESVPYWSQSMGDGDGTSDLWEGMNFKGCVYRRGKTNTRIYLLMMEDRDGNQIGLWMTYIPTFYVQEMRQAWLDAHKKLEQAKSA